MAFHNAQTSTNSETHHSAGVPIRKIRWTQSVRPSPQPVVGPCTKYSTGRVPNGQVHGLDSQGWRCAGSVGVSRWEWKSSIFHVHCHSSLDQVDARSYSRPLFQSLRFDGTATSVCRGQAVSEANQAHQLAM